MATNSARKAQTDGEVPAVVRAPFALPAEFVKALEESGVNTAAIAVPEVQHFEKIEWDELCYLATRDPKTAASPICIVHSVTEQPEATGDYDAYVGMIRIEFTTESMNNYAVTHSRCYADSGEFLPLTEWVRTQVPPFAMRFGYVETRKAGRHVVRPLPINIPIS
jgi:hypothetical protein